MSHSQSNMQSMQPQQSNQFGGMNSGINSGINNNMNDGQKKVSFDSNIKVVELDTKISDGFFYSGSKNLDPFSNGNGN